MQNKILFYSVCLFFSLIIILFFSILIKQKENIADLELFLSTIKTNTVVTEEMPVFSKIANVLYDKQNRRDPFSIVLLNNHNIKEKLPINYRNILSLYPLSSLKLVGVIESNKDLYALIEAPDHKSYRVKRGDIISNEDMQVVDMNKEGIIVEKMVKNSWRKDQSVHIKFEKKSNIITMSDTGE